jgi:hypothetical protein
LSRYINQEIVMKNKKAGAAKRAAEGVVAVQSSRGAAAMREAARGAKRIQEVAEQFRNASHVNHTAGRLFEELHATSANVDGALKGLPQRFATTASQGDPHAAADIVVKLGDRTVGAAQAKLSESSTALLSRVSRKDYTGMQKLLPIDKVDSVRRLADRLAKDGRRPDLDLADTAKRASARLQYKGAASKPVTVAEAQAAARAPARTAARIERDASAQAYGSAAATGAVLGGAMSLVDGGSVGDAAVAAGKGAARAMVQQAATRGVEEAGKALVGKTAASVLGKSGAGAIAGAGIGIASDLVDLASGDIDGVECATRACKHGVRAGTTWAGAEAGAMAGAFFGPVGVAVGGLVGGFLGSFVPDLF